MLNKKVTFILFFLLLISAAFIYKQVKGSSFKLDLPYDSCVDQTSLQEEIRASNKGYYLVDLNKLSEEIKKKFPCIKEINFNFSIFNGYSANIVKRVPLARVIPTSSAQDLSLEGTEASASTQSALIDWRFDEASSSADYLIVDNEGVIFDKKDDNNLPLLYINNDNLGIGTALPANFFQNIGKVFEKLSEFGGNFTQFKLISQYFLLDGNPRVIFDLGGDINRQLISLQLILNKARMDNNEIESIDLRFKNPVIKYSTKKTKNKE